MRKKKNADLLRIEEKQKKIYELFNTGAKDAVFHDNFDINIEKLNKGDTLLIHDSESIVCISARFFEIMKKIEEKEVKLIYLTDELQVTFNIKKRKTVGRKFKIDDKIIVKLIKKYKEGWTVHKLMEYFSVSKGCLYAYIKRHGVEKRGHIRKNT